ncbi:hypothetical protein ABK040_001986 [Willaertia magna]
MSTTTTINYLGGEYKGPVNERGEPHGHGTLVFPLTKHKYEGEFQNGKAHGKGIASGSLTLETCNILNNELREISNTYTAFQPSTATSTIHSSGSSPSLNTSSTAGSSNNLTPSTTNRTSNEYKPNEWKYEGEWKDGNMEGQGTFTFPNGDLYDGQWKENKPTGQGLYTWNKTQNRYMGEFKDLYRHGSGTMLYNNNGYKFDGHFFMDVRQGQGVESFPNGNKYEGYWLLDKRHGKGYYYMKFDNLDKKLQKRRKQTLKSLKPPASLNTNSGSVNGVVLNGLQLESYVVYLHEYSYGVKISEKELFPNDYPNLEPILPPKELSELNMDKILYKIDEEIDEIVNDMDGNENYNLLVDYDNVFVQGMINWKDDKWEMIQDLFVSQYTLNVELSQAKKKLISLDMATYLEQKVNDLKEKVDLAENAKGKTKSEMKRVIEQVLEYEAPNDFDGINVFQEKLEEIINELVNQIQECEEKKKNATKDEDALHKGKQLVEDLEKKVFRLESGIQTTKNTVTGLKIPKDNVLYAQIQEFVTIHLQRLRVILSGLVNKEKEKKLKVTKDWLKEAKLLQNKY